jgi:4-hydroxy-3-methylbut-2-enyl diphosphate reductase
MASITVADQAGACYGVERALELVARALDEADGPVRTLGPLIHNPKVVAELEGRGVAVAADTRQAPGSTIVIRSHGVAPEVIEGARARGLVVVDATCPYVKKVHHAAARLLAGGYQVIVVGEAGHPEVEGTIGHAPGAVAVESASDLDAIELGRRVGVVVQTTQSAERLREVVDALLARVEEVCVVNTICEATSQRQQAAGELATRSDVMVVVGGRNSGNTTRLAEICSRACPRTHHVEGPEELEAGWFEGAQSIGLTAGASTPAAQISQVVDAIRALSPQAGEDGHAK